LLSILEQNPGTSWESVLNVPEIKKTKTQNASPKKPDSLSKIKPTDSKTKDDLMSFKL
jgi:hypothetical protein